MITVPGNPPSSTDGLPSIIISARSSSFSTSSSSTIPSKSSHTSIFILSPSPKPDENTLPTSAPPESMNGSPYRRWSPRTSNKRKRDSEPRNMNGSQLREAQEKVEQKRAKIAARVPSAMAPAGNARPAPAAVTSLADLYAQMRRDSGASGQSPASSVVPSPKPMSGNGRILDSPTQNTVTPRGRSLASSPDPIAIGEDDPEIMILKHVPSSPQVHTGFKPAVRLAPVDLKSLSKAKSGTSTLKSVGADGVERLLGKSRKPKLTFAVVVPSPPKRFTHHRARVGRDTSGRDSSRSQDSIPARTLAPKHAEKLKEKMHVSETPASHTPTSVPTRPSRSDSTTEYGIKRSRRILGLSEDLTPRDIDSLLDAVPLPLDLSLSRHHLTSRKNCDSEGQNEGSSLWWYHPIFEARAKADIRRTLSALLPDDPAQDPPSPVGGVAGWRAEVRPRQSRARMWAERLEDAFGPGPLDRGLGRKPRRVARPAGAAKRESATSSRYQHVPGTVVVLANSHTSVPHRILEPPSRHRSPKDAPDVALIPPVDDSVALVKANVDGSESEAAAWTAAILPLVKGKTTMDGQKMEQISDALGEVERASQRGSISREVLKESALADTVRRLGELDGPFGEAYHLRVRARTLAEQWRHVFGEEVVDLQREVLQRVS